MFASIALFFTSIAPAIYSFNYYFTLFITPMFFLGDVFFPVSSLPTVVQKIAWVVPLTPVANLMRSAVEGNPGEGAWWGLAIILAYIAVFFPLSLVMMKRRLFR
jgi:lipooligosaccharide transport system permease protein